jgi:hypothetical protein
VAERIGSVIPDTMAGRAMDCICLKERSFIALDKGTLTIH